jgi:two-component system KDP operon response regulator KdpE
VVVNLAARTVTRQGDSAQRIRLTPTEWRLLEALVQQPGMLVGRSQLLTKAWGPGAQDKSHYLRLYMARLRSKLEPDQHHPRYLLTEPGMGYRFQP